jgi:hypothetical protein
LERFASVQARLDQGALLGDVLAAEGLSEEVWRSAQRGWLALIGSEAERHRYQLSQRYQEAYLAAGSGLLVVTPSGGDSVEAEDDQEPQGSVTTTASVGILELGAGAALPFAAGDGSGAPAPSAQGVAHGAAGDTLDPNELADGIDLHGTTAGLTLDMLGLGAALPFAQSKASSKAEERPSSPGAQAMADDALPFSKRAPAPLGAPPAPERPPAAVALPPPVLRPQPAAPPAVLAPPIREERPARGPEPPPVHHPALPFRTGAAVVPAPIVAELPPIAPDLLGFTADGALISPLAKQRATPFSPEPARPTEPAATPALPELTLDQYASLCAERATFPEQEEAIARKYGLATAQLGELDDLWRRALQADEGKRHDFDGKVEQFSAWLRQRR